MVHVVDLYKWQQAVRQHDPHTKGGQALQVRMCGSPLMQMCEKEGTECIRSPKWFHFIILYTYIHDVLCVIYNLLKHAFKNRFEEHGDPRSVCYCTGLEFLFPSHRGPLKVYLRAWIWKIQLQLPHPTPWTALQNVLSSCGFKRTDAKDKISLKGIWGMGPKNHHIFLSLPESAYIFRGTVHLCGSKPPIIFPSNIITAFFWKCQTLRWNTASEIFT